MKWYNWFSTGAWYLATCLFLKLRIVLLSLSILLVIHSITSGKGKTRVLAAAHCSPDLEIFLYMPLLSSVLGSYCRKNWNTYVWNSWNKVFHLKAIFVLTRHSMSVNAYIYFFSTGSLMVFLLLFKAGVNSILFMNHNISHDAFILFH